MKRSATIVSAAWLLTAAFSSAALAAHAYEVAIVQTSTTAAPTYYRIDVATGQVDYVSGVQYLATKDSAPIAQGDYHLYSAVDGKNTYWLFRVDSQSGHTWFLTNGSWTEVPEPK